MFTIESYTHLPSHVSSSLKKMIKNVQVTGDTIDEDDLDEAVGLHFTAVPRSPHLLSKGCQGARTARKRICRCSEEGGMPLDCIKTRNGVSTYCRVKAKTKPGMTMSAAWTLWKWMLTPTSRWKSHLRNQKGRRPPERRPQKERRKCKNPSLKTTRRRNLRQGRLPAEQRRNQRRKNQRQRNRPQGAAAQRKLWYVDLARRYPPLIQPSQEESEGEDDDIEEIEPPKKKGRAAVLRYGSIKFQPPALTAHLIFRRPNSISPSQPAKITKKAPAKKTPASGSKAGTLSFAPSGRKPRGAAKD